MTQSISFIHAADLHLDSPFKGLTNIPSKLFQDVRESTFTALDNLVQIAILKQVDFVLFVGDLFDNEKQSLKAQVKLRTACETLQANEIDVFLSYGNHDHVLGNPYRLPFPDNVHIFSSEHVEQLIYEKDHEKRAAIYGFSYHERAVRMNKTEEYDKQDDQIPFHIATLHGSLHGNQTHDPYAPFTLKELQNKPFDYWALGHIHERAELSHHPPIIYPGNIQGRHRNETGEKGCYYVQMTETDTSYDFIPLQSIQFIEQRIDISACATIHDLESTIQSAIPRSKHKQLLRITLYSEHNQTVDVKDEEMMQELIDIINESLMEEKYWQFIYTYKLEVRQPTTIAVEEKFVEEIERALDTTDVNQTLADLYRHPIARKFVNKLDHEEIKQAAHNLLLYELLQTEERDEQ